MIISVVRALYFDSSKLAIKGFTGMFIPHRFRGADLLRYHAWLNIGNLKTKIFTRENSFVYSTLIITLQ